MSRWKSCRCDNGDNVNGGLGGESSGKDVGVSEDKSQGGESGGGSRSVVRIGTRKV